MRFEIMWVVCVGNDWCENRLHQFEEFTDDEEYISFVDYYYAEKDMREETILDGITHIVEAESGEQALDIVKENIQSYFSANGTCEIYDSNHYTCSKDGWWFEFIDFDYEEV